MKNLKLLWSFLLIGIVILFGCNQSNAIDTNRSLIFDSNKIKEIELTCTKLCQEMYPNQLKTIKYTEQETLKLFTETMENVVKISGILDYAVLFKMKITFNDHTIKNYTLNIENEKDRKGLLVEESDSSVGYTIPTEYYNKLSLLIFRHKEQ